MVEIRCYTIKCELLRSNRSFIQKFDLIDDPVFNIYQVRNFFLYFNLIWDNFQVSGSLKEKEFEDTKLVIRIRNSKDRQHNGKKKKDKRTNNDIQNKTPKTKNRATRTPLRTVGKFWCSGKGRSSCSQTCQYGHLY